MRSGVSMLPASVNVWVYKNRKPVLVCETGEIVKRRLCISCDEHIDHICMCFKGPSRWFALNSMSVFERKLIEGKAMDHAALVDFIDGGRFG